MTPEQKPDRRPSGRLQHGDHLQYLLTAYLFGDLSAAGKAEVEGHLKDCANCRQELADLRATLALTEEVIRSDKKEYVFDDRRRARVLAGAKQARHGFLAKMGLTAWPRFNPNWGRIAALILVLLTGGMLLVTQTLSCGGDFAPREQARRTAYGKPSAALERDGGFSYGSATEGGSEDTIVTSSLERQKPGEYDARGPVDKFKNPADAPEDLPPVEHPVVTHEASESSGHVDRRDDRDSAAAKGDDWAKLPASDLAQRNRPAGESRRMVIRGGGAKAENRPSSGKEGEAALPIETPKPVFIGTPKAPPTGVRLEPKTEPAVVAESNKAGGEDGDKVAPGKNVNVGGRWLDNKEIEKKSESKPASGELAQVPGQLAGTWELEDKNEFALVDQAKKNVQQEERLRFRQKTLSELKGQVNDLRDRRLVEERPAEPPSDAPAVREPALPPVTKPSPQVAEALREEMKRAVDEAREGKADQAQRRLEDVQKKLDESGLSDSPLAQEVAMLNYGCRKRQQLGETTTTIGKVAEKPAVPDVVANSIVSPEPSVNFEWSKDTDSKLGLSAQFAVTENKLSDFQKGNLTVDSYAITPDNNTRYTWYAAKESEKVRVLDAKDLNGTASKDTFYGTLFREEAERKQAAATGLPPAGPGTSGADGTFKYADAVDGELRNLKKNQIIQKEQQAVEIAGKDAKVNVNAADSLALVLDKATTAMNKPATVDEGRKVTDVGVLGLLNDRREKAGEKNFGQNPQSFRWQFTGQVRKDSVDTDQRKDDANKGVVTTIEGLKRIPKEAGATEAERLAARQYYARQLLNGTEGLLEQAYNGRKVLPQPARDEKDTLSALVEQQQSTSAEFARQGDLKPDFLGSFSGDIDTTTVAESGRRLALETLPEPLVPSRAERAQAEKDAQIRRLQEEQTAAAKRERELLEKQQLALAQNQEQAETLDELVQRSAGVQQQVEQKARTDAFSERLKQLEGTERVRIQEQVAVLSDAMKEAEKLARKAEESVTELHGGQAEAEREQLLADKLDNLRQAELRYRRVKEIMNYMPQNFDMPNERRTVDAGLEKTKNAIAAAEEELSFSRRQEASKIAEEQGLKETLLFKQRIQKLTEETRNLIDRGEHRSAEKLAMRVLQLDPLNTDAEALKRQARQQQHAQADLGELKERYKEATIQNWETTEANHIPYGDLLVYPTNWDEIARRPERMAIGKKVNEEQWKTDIRRKLQRKVSFEFVDTPLDEAVNYLRSLTNVTIVVDPKVKESAPKINLRVTDMSTDLALGWVLRLADLDYSFRDKSVYVSKKKNLVEDVELRIYDVADLTRTVRDMPGPNLELQQTNVQNEQAVADGLSAASLAQLIRDKLFPDAFDPAQGTSIEERSGRLVVMNRPEVHARIDAFLETLRGPDPDRSERLVRACRFFQSDNKRLDIDEFLRRPASIPAPFVTDEGLDEDAFIEKYGIRPFVDASRDHLSTFGLDVDTASYTRTRALLQQGQLPPADAVRTEEFVNYFKQDYTVPPNETFGVFIEGMPASFGASGMELVKIGIKSRDPRPDERKPAALTFVVDVSGSMARADSSGRERVELIRAALKALVEALQREDSVCLVTFSDQARLALPRTQARFASRILDALNRLEPGGATNVEAGIEMGYRMADEAYSKEAINRVIFCSDGVANVGAQGVEPMLKLVKTFASRGIDLNAIGFGMGKYNDKVMQELADRGNGQYHFVNTPEEAQKIFREQLPPHLDTLARDAKAQVDFDPAVVKRYRLLGYEKRKIADADFRNDKIDAGEVAHSTLVTALYEIERQPGAHGSLGKIFLRWKDAALPHRPVVERNYPLSEGLIASTREAAAPNLRFLACVAEFAELLRNSRWAQDGSYAAVLKELNRLPPDFRVKPEWDEVRKLVWQAHVLSMREWLGALKGTGAKSE